MPRAEVTPAELARVARAGDIRARARALTLVERGGADREAILSALGPPSPDALSVGFTGPPGVGKSTLVSRLTAEARRRGQTVAVLAIDPSSPITGGALLGDRIRMQEHVGDAGVLVRSMASRGSVGGLARAASATIRALRALGFDFVFVETVGTGQDETDVATVTPTVVLVQAPQLGDDVQAIKAGVLEIADIIVVNKSDSDGANQAVSTLRQMLALGHRPDGWHPPILKTIATDGTGVPALLDAILGYRAHLVESGQAEHRSALRARDDLLAATADRLIGRLLSAVPPDRTNNIVRQLAGGEITLSAAVDALIAARGES